MAPRHAVVVLGLAAGTAHAGPAVVDGAAPPLRLVWVDPSDVAADSELAARAEAERLLARMGGAVSWRRAAPGEMLRRDEVSVVLLGEGPPAPGPPVLGATRTGGGVARVAWVRVPNVRTAVGVCRSGSTAGIDRLRVATALGRVVAHEVVHVVAPTVVHGAGLMSRSLDCRRLTAPGIAVEAETALAVRAALRAGPFATSSDVRVLAAVDAEKDR